MGFSSSNNMTKRRDGSITNSTRSCRIEDNKGWSYGELIGLRLDGITIFNCHNFSVTTTKHQYSIQAKMTIGQKIYLDLNSMNNIESVIKIKKLDEFLSEKTYVNSKSDFSGVLEILTHFNYSKRKINKVLLHLNSKKIKNDLDTKKIKREYRLQSNIENLNYKTPSTLKKALISYAKHDFKRWILSHNVSPEKIDLLFLTFEGLESKIVESILSNNSTIKSLWETRQKIKVLNELGD